MPVAGSSGSIAPGTTEKTIALLTSEPEPTASVDSGSMKRESGDHPAKQANIQIM